jgi:NAD(P)-dependent dehydrogenase (short-subunit alcohol dehydrogenase family)
MTMLHNKNAIIYGAGGSLGGAVARAFATAGAKVFLAGRTLAPLQKLAENIHASGGSAEVFELDALNETAVKENVAAIVKDAGTLDISLNLIGLEVVQGMPLTDISPEDFIRPVTIAMRTHFLTSIAAAKIMMKQRSGAILSLTATGGGIGYPFTGGFGPACCAIEAFSTNLASELGVYGIRVVNIRSAGSPDSRVFKEAIERDPELMKSLLRGMEADTMLKQLPLMDDISNAAVFLASDMARKITGVTLDVTAGSTAALNYRVNPIIA